MRFHPQWPSTTQSASGSSCPHSPTTTHRKHSNHSSRSLPTTCSHSSYRGNNRKCSNCSTAQGHPGKCGGCGSGSWGPPRRRTPIGERGARRGPPHGPAPRCTPHQCATIPSSTAHSREQRQHWQRHNLHQRQKPQSTSHHRQQRKPQHHQNKRQCHNQHPDRQQPHRQHRPRQQPCPPATPLPASQPSLSSGYRGWPGRWNVLGTWRHPGTLDPGRAWTQDRHRGGDWRQSM